MSKVLEKVDWNLLKEQNESLFALTMNVKEHNLSKVQLDALDGIINLIDSLRDENDGID
jgi:hypothetical protein